MNERINEIAKQAWNLCPDPYGETSFDALNKFEQKFAQLLLQECMNITGGCSTKNGLYADVIIAEYFGVE